MDDRRRIRFQAMGVALLCGAGGWLALTQPSQQVLLPMVGALFVVAGAIVQSLRWKAVIGIRMSWTLAHERVWNRSHRFGGRLMMACGLLLAVSELLGTAPRNGPGVIALLSVACVVAIVAKSYVYGYRETHPDV